MHTTQYNESKIVFLHNGDYSGDVIIRDTETGNEVRCDIKDLESFLGDKIKDEFIDYVERFEIFK